ncbi:endodeoxyribonuclease [Cryomyces antarcticus]|nr:endodeoxyribonuclease [Cryomyces antarcticus]
MDDGGSNDMLFEASLLQDSSQESLTDTALHSWNIASGSGLPVKTYISRDISECGAVSAGLAESSPYGGHNSRHAPQASAPPALSSPAGAVGDREFVLCKIESIFEKIADVLLNGGDRLIIPLKIRSGISGRGFDEESRIVTSESSIRTRDITFPGSTAQEAWRFSSYIRLAIDSYSEPKLKRRVAVLIRILELVHEALTAEVVITKRSQIISFSYQSALGLTGHRSIRDIYYRDPALFVKQSVVDLYVDDHNSIF